jgi:type I restriction enzyme S subunit
VDEWIVYYLNWADLMPFVTGLTVPKLNQEKLNSIPIPIPKMAEQRTLLAKMDDLRLQIESLKAKYSARLEQISELRQALLQKAFSGELTSPQSQAIKEAAE